MSTSVLVLYVGRKRGADVLLYDDKGMLKEEQTLTPVEHIRIETGECSTNVSFSEFDVAIVIKVSGKVGFNHKNNVFEVRCVGD